jgi:hypothetical protein
VKGIGHNTEIESRNSEMNRTVQHRGNTTVKDRGNSRV